jgi:hypothetical protein
MKTHMHLLRYLAQFFLRVRNISDKIVEKTRTHISGSINLLRKSCMYEIMLTNRVEADGPQLKI